MAIIPEEQVGSASATTAALTRDPVCAVLRKAREQAGYDIVDIAQLLRIQRNYLEAIEEGRYGDLPGTVYAIGFVRTYSDFLNLDTADLVRRFKEEAMELSRRTDYVFPVPPAEARVPGTGVLVVGVLLAALAYGAWFVYSSDDIQLVAGAPDIPDRFAELAARGDAQSAANSDRADTGTGSASPESINSGSAVAGSLADPAPQSGSLTNSESAPQLETWTSPPDLDRLAAIAEQRTSAETALDVPGNAPAAAEVESAVEEVPVPAPTPPPQAVPVEVVEQAPVAPVAPPAPAAVIVAAEPAPEAASPVRGNAPIETVLTVEPIRRVPPPLGGEAPDPVEVAVASGTNGLPKANNGQSTDGPTNILPTSRTTIAAAPPPPPPAVPTDQARRNGLGDLNSRILIRATEMSWVQITDDLGNLVMTRVLDRGETYRVPNSDGLTLASGNAGGLEVLIDGVTQGPLGLRGTVVRNVSLDPDNFGVR